MLKLVLIITFSFVVTDYSDEFRGNFVMSENKFKCFEGSQKISIEQIGDNQCDCCDGSDEIFNKTLYCPYTCNSYQNIDTAKLKKIYEKSIFYKKKIYEDSRKESDKILGRYKEYKDKLEEMKQNISDIKKSIEKYRSEFTDWVYQMNDMKRPTSDELLVEKETYIQKHLIHFENKDYEDEIPEGYDTRLVGKNSQIRQEKEEEFETIKLKESKKLLAQAVSRLKNSLKNSTSDYLELVKKYLSSLPEPVLLYDKMKSKKVEAKKELSTLKDDYYEFVMIVERHTEHDHLYRSSPSDPLNGNVKGTNLVLVMDLKDTLYLREATTKKTIAISEYKHTVSNKLIYADNDYHMNIKSLCYYEDLFFHAYRPYKKLIYTVVGTPDACPDEFDEKLFNDWTYEILRYYPEVAKQSSEL